MANLPNPLVSSSSVLQRTRSAPKGEKREDKLPSSPICSFSSNWISPATLFLCGGIMNKMKASEKESTHFSEVVSNSEILLKWHIIFQTRKDNFELKNWNGIWLHLLNFKRKVLVYSFRIVLQDPSHFFSVQIKNEIFSWYFHRKEWVTDF